MPLRGGGDDTQSNASCSTMATVAGGVIKSEAVNSLYSPNVPPDESAPPSRGDDEKEKKNLFRRLYERLYTRKVLLFFMAATYFLAYVDHGSVTSLLTDMRTDRDISGSGSSNGGGGGGKGKGAAPLSESKGGFIVSAFMIGFLVGSPIFSALGRIVSARYIVAFGLATLFASSFATGLATNYGLLIAARFFTGIGESAARGYLVTMIDNIAPPRRRTLWIGIFLSMMPVGTACGMAFSGIIASSDLSSVASALGRPDMPAWRLVFFGIALLALPFASAVVCYPTAYGANRVGVRKAPAEDQTKKEANAATTSTEEGRSAESENGAAAIAVRACGDACAGGCVCGALLVLNDDDANAAGETSEAAPLLSQQQQQPQPQKLSTDHAHPLVAIRALFRAPIYALLVLGMGSFMLLNNGAAVVAIPMLRVGPWQLSQAHASALVGALLAVPGFIGTMAGGIVLDRLGGSKGPLGIFRCCRHIAIAASIGFPIALGALFVYQVPPYAALLAASSLCLISAIAPANAAMLSSVDIDVRTYAMSYSAMIERLIAFPGATVVGALADAFSHGCHAHPTEAVCLSGRRGGGDDKDDDDSNNVTTTEDDHSGNSSTTAATTLAAPFFELPRNSLGGAADDFFSLGDVGGRKGGGGGSFSTPIASPECVWLPGNKGGNGHCMAEFEGRDAAFYYKLGAVVPIALWTAAACLAYRSLQRAQRAADGETAPLLSSAPNNAGSCESNIQQQAEK